MNTKLSRVAVLAATIAMTGAIIGGTSGTAAAAPKGLRSAATQTQQSQLAATPVPSAESVPATSPLHALNGHVSFSKDGYSLDAPASILAQVPTADLDNFKTYLAQVNSAVKSGKLVMSADGVATPAGSSSSPRVSANAVEGRAAAATSHGYIKSHWYGLEVGLDSWLTNKVEGGAWTGAGLGGLAVLLGDGPYAGAVAGALAIAAGEIQVCQHQDGWTIIYWLGAISPTAFVCNPFG